MEKLSLDDFLKLRKLVFRGARPLEFTMWKCDFENGRVEAFISILSSYQNEDGGFGHALEANCWNPDSSPYVTDQAIRYLDGRGYSFSDRNHPVLRGILKYLASGEYMTEAGWLGMGSIPSNNDYSHLPWFHYGPEKASEVDVELTDNLMNFILKYADNDSDIFRKAVALKDSRKLTEQAAIPDFTNFDPAKWEPWNLMPVTFVGSPESEYYPALKDIVDKQLDAIVDRLRGTNKFPVMSEEEIIRWEKNWEKNFPRTDGKRWCDSEQTIGNYYWHSGDLISQIGILKNFGRLDFELPVRNK